MYCEINLKNTEIRYLLAIIIKQNKIEFIKITFKIPTNRTVLTISILLVYNSYLLNVM